MTKVTYLDHSGFVLEHGNIVLIFDYYKGDIPVFDKEMHIYMFSSHRHGDHFQESIFELGKIYPNVTYILSSDIQTESFEGSLIFMDAREEKRVGDLQVYTCRSTDQGVAFLVSFNGIRIYHAGDLNWWHWEEESKTYNEMMKRRYQHEIKKLSKETIDVAFVPVDPRLGKQYYYGLDYFMKNTDTKYVFPMHMWGKYSIYNKLKQEKEAASYIDCVQEIHTEGEVFELSL